MTTIKELDGAPSILAGYGKAFASALPVLGSLPLPIGLPGGGGDLPDLELRAPLTTDLTHLAAYAKVCGFTLRDTLPATYLNVRAFPVHIALMTDGAFPFGPVGLVHLTNTIEHRRPVGVREELALRVWATGLDPHPKGRTVTLHTEVSDAGGEVVWTAASTMLRTGGGDPSARVERAPDPEVPASVTWKVPGDQGRRYAAVSGDRNPIHLYGLTAKAFGFPRAIAHGLWTKARAVAALEAQLPDAFTVDVEFRKPVLLPTTVTFGSVTDAKTGVTSFAVKDRRKGSAHLVGSVTPLKPAKKKRATARRKTTSETTKSGASS